HVGRDRQRRRIASPDRRHVHALRIYLGVLRVTRVVPDDLAARIEDVQRDRSFGRGLQVVVQQRTLHAWRTRRNVEWGQVGGYDQVRVTVGPVVARPNNDKNRSEEQTSELQS